MCAAPAVSVIENMYLPQTPTLLARFVWAHNLLCFELVFWWLFLTQAPCIVHVVSASIRMVYVWIFVVMVGISLTC